jgi:hypothetical protein
MPQKPYVAQDPDGRWYADSCSVMSESFDTEAEAYQWALDRLWDKLTAWNQELLNERDAWKDRSGLRLTDQRNCENENIRLRTDLDAARAQAQAAAEDVKRLTAERDGWRRIADDLHALYTDGTGGISDCPNAGCQEQVAEALNPERAPAGGAKLERGGE